jgi:uncharacterized membrane protein YdfJ with MMPL/SSD domain
MVISAGILFVDEGRSDRENKGLPATATIRRQTGPKFGYPCENDAMDTDDAKQIITLLEQIRDGQQLQLQRQAQALERQAEVFARQQEHFANLKQQSGNAQALQDRAEQIQAKSAQLVGGARAIVLIAVPFALLLLVFVCWLVFSRAAS